MLKRRHSTAEIAAKLREAESLAAQGKRQQEIARALGISVMTFHRWRKAFGQGGEHPPQTRPEATDGHGDRELMQQRMADLQLENSRLRRLVTDLLLEKIRLEETVSASIAKGSLIKHASRGAPLRWADDSIQLSDSGRLSRGS